MDDDDSLSQRAREWLVDQGWPIASLSPLGGDVSSRRYWRVCDDLGNSRIVGWYPVAIREAAERFRATTALLTAAGIRVPVIERVEAGWMLLEDLGPETLYDRRHRSWSRLEVALTRARALLAPLQAVQLSRELLGPLDGVVLAAELEQTWELYLEPAGLDRRTGVGSDLAELLDAVCRVLDREPRVPCHRDFMARNLVPLGPGDDRLAVLDHQDLRLGPADYDLASLLNDSLYPPRQLRDRLLGDRGAVDAGYWSCVVQRTLKIVGTFHRFALRGQPRYLVLIPATLERTLEALERLPRLGGPELARALRAERFGAG